MYPFLSVKSFVCQEFQKLARNMEDLDELDADNVLAVSFQVLYSIRNIWSGFHKSGNFNFDDLYPLLTH